MQSRQRHPSLRIRCGPRVPHFHPNRAPYNLPMPGMEPSDTPIYLIRLASHGSRMILHRRYVKFDTVRDQMPLTRNISYTVTAALRRDLVWHRKVTNKIPSTADGDGARRTKLASPHQPSHLHPQGPSLSNLMHCSDMQHR